MKYFDQVFKADFNIQCAWQPANQFLFQLANVFLLLSYFVNPSSLAGLFQLRVALTLAGLCFGLWGGAIICSLDCMLWNLAFAVGNALHVVYLIVKMRPIRFSQEHEELYVEIFKPVGVKRFQYQRLVELAKRRYLKQGEYYAKQGITAFTHMGIISSGSLEVHIQNIAIHHINVSEFVDSPEWISTVDASPTKYQVSLLASCPCMVFVWSREDLLKLFKKDNILKNVFDSLIGKDISKKLFSVHNHFLMKESGKLSNILHDAPLLTYSAANLYELHQSAIHSALQSPISTPVISPRVSPRVLSHTSLSLESIHEKGDISTRHQSKDNSFDKDEECENENENLWEDDFDVIFQTLERKNLIMRETNL